MATYKVIQDIEAEDKILGPLTLRQFIFGLGAAFGYYISFILLTKHVGILLIIFLPPTLFATFFAIPFGRDQPTEVWAIAKLRFLFKPRRRIWDQSGIKELVSITVPKKVEEMRTDGLSAHEVNSRLSALANTIDSRGWAVKNVNLNLSGQSAQALTDSTNSDRLIGTDGLPQDVPTTDIQAADDIMDEQNNPIAHQFDQMIAASSQAHRQQLTDMMSQASPAPAAAPATTQQSSATTNPPADYWFLNQPVEPPKLAKNQAMFASTAVTPGVVDDAQGGVAQASDPTAEEAALGQRIKAEHAKPNTTYSHLKTIQPLGTQSTPASPSQTAAKTPTKAVTPGPKPAILDLANNNDLNVATIARQANKVNPDSLDDDGEVVIALR